MSGRSVMRALFALQGVALLAFVVMTMLPAPGGVATFRDVYLINFVLGFPAVIVFLRGLRFRAERWTWLVSLGILAFVAGNLIYVGYVQYQVPEPKPSIADAFFLAFYPLVVGGLLWSLRGAHQPIRRSVLLDALVAFLGASSAGGAFIVAPLVHQSSGTWSEVAAVAALPVGDVMIIAMVLGVFVLRGGRMGTYGWIGAGLTLFTVADTVYMFRIAYDNYVLGTPLDALWAVGMTVVAIGVWRPSKESAHERVTSAWTLTAPVLSSVLALVVMVTAAVTERSLPLVIVLAAAATLLAASGRMVDGFMAVRDLARARMEARTDELTGLGNRRLMYESIDERLLGLRDGTLVHLLLLDLDRFKEINDSLGHPVGDEVLRTVARRLTSWAGPDDVLARLGGDEFAVLVTRSEPGFDVRAAADRMLAAISAPITVSGLTLQIGASVGISVAPVDSLDRTDLVRHADVAMYEAKNTNRGVSLYDPERDSNSRERLQLVGELRDAFAKDPDQLVVYFQPKCTVDGRVVGAEALIRWRHPVHGLLLPDVFVPIAENHSLMPALTRLVLRRALVQCRTWREYDPRATVAVNLSVTSLLDETLIEDITLALADCGLAPDGLILEITETLVMSDPERSRRTLRALREIGVQLAIDDYGTGHCSLAYLRELPVQELKLDRSFVRHIASDARDAAIVGSTIDLAHALDLVLVAEGVEDAEAVRLLAGMGCDLTQGYYFGRPKPATDRLADLLDAARVDA